MGLFKLMIPFTAIAFLSTPNCSDGGWYKKVTGQSTPAPIQKIAPNGISIKPKSNDRPAANMWTVESSTGPTNYGGNIQTDKTVQKRKTNVQSDNTVQKRPVSSNSSNTKVPASTGSVPSKPSDAELIAGAIGQIVGGISQASQNQPRPQQSSPYESRYQSNPSSYGTRVNQGANWQSGRSNTRRSRGQ